MGKTKSIHGAEERQHAIDFFIQVFIHLVSLHKEREKFVLTWIWNDSTVLELFLDVVMGFPNGSKELLWNGYRLCRRDRYHVFPKSTWARIDEMFLNKRLLCNLPHPVRNLLTLLKSASLSELKDFIRWNERKVDDSSQHSQVWKAVHKMSDRSIRSMEDCFLGEWLTPADQIFRPALAQVCKTFPPECVLARDIGDLTYFYERQGSTVEVIAVLLKNSLQPKAMDYIRSLMEDLFASHPKISRQSMASLDSHMTAFGPLWRRYVLDGGSKVSFYTHAEKLGGVLRQLSEAREFEMLVDRYAHRHLSEIILALFMWKLPMFVGSFLDYSKPYLGPTDYDMSNWEDLLECGPCTYQLFITKDFCSQIHKDRDRTKFTLSYCSHPDAESTTPVEFIMAEHGLRIPVHNGSLFAFNSSLAHGTAYRNHTHNAAYMGFLVVNSALHALTRRRQLL